MSGWATDNSTDPHQHGYRRNRSTADTISYVVHLVLTHLECRNSYFRLLFLDLGSNINTISHIPETYIVRFVDDIAVLGLISHYYRAINPCINVKETNEMIVDFRKILRSRPTLLCIGGAFVKVVSRFKYLGIHINDDLTWITNSSISIKKAHQ